MAIVTFATLNVLTSSESWDERIRARFTPDGDPSRAQEIETGGLGSGSVMALGISMQFTNDVVATFTEIDIVTPNDALGTVTILASDPPGPFSRSFTGDGGSYMLVGTLVPTPVVVDPPDLPDTPDLPDPEVPEPPLPQPLHVLVDNPLEVLGLVAGLDNVTTAIGTLTTAQNGTNTAVGTVGTNVGNAVTAISAVGTAVGNLQAAIAGVDTSVDAVASNVGALKPELTSINTSVGSLKPSVDALGSAFTTANGHLSAINGSLATLAQIKSELTTANTHLAGMAAGLATLTQIKSELTTLNTKIDATNAKLTDVVTKLNDISGKLPL